METKENKTGKLLQGFKKKIKKIFFLNKLNENLKKRYEKFSRLNLVDMIVKCDSAVSLHPTCSWERAVREWLMVTELVMRVSYSISCLNLRIFHCTYWHPVF